MHTPADSDDHEDGARSEDKDPDPVPDPPASEITMRISLLGKLILPPDPR